MLDQLIMLVFLIVLLLLGLQLLDAVIRRPSLMAAMLITTRVIDYAVSLPNVIVAGFNLYTADLLVVLAIAALAARALRGLRSTTLHAVLLLLVTVGFLSFLRGLAEFGPKEAVVSLRGSVFPLVLAAYFALLAPSEKVLADLRRFWVYGALVLTGLAVIRWIARAAGLASMELLRPPSDAGARVLDSNEALVIAQAFLMMLPALKGGPESRRALWIGGWLLSIAVLLEHRSVWVALLCSLAVIAVRDRQLSRRLTALVVSAAAVGSLLALTVFSGTGGEVTDSLSRSATDTGTWEWRVQGWRLLLEDAAESDTMEKVIGKPLGTPFERTVNTRTVTSQPHNYYIQVLLRFGIIGLALLIALYVMCFTRLARIATAPGSLITSDMMIVLLVSQLAYFINYAARLEQGLIIGMAVALAARGTFTSGTPSPTAELQILREPVT